MIRVVLPPHRGSWRAVARGAARRRGSVTVSSVLDALEARYPMLRGDDPRPGHATAPAVRAVLRLRGDLSTNRRRPTADAVATGAEPFWSWGPCPAVRGSTALRERSSCQRPRRMPRSARHVAADVPGRGTAANPPTVTSRSTRTRADPDSDAPPAPTVFYRDTSRTSWRRTTAPTSVSVFSLNRTGVVSMALLFATRADARVPRLQRRPPTSSVASSVKETRRAAAPALAGRAGAAVVALSATRLLQPVDAGSGSRGAASRVVREFRNPVSAINQVGVGGTRRRPLRRARGHGAAHVLLLGDHARPELAGAWSARRAAPSGGLEAMRPSRGRRAGRRHDRARHPGLNDAEIPRILEAAARAGRRARAGCSSSSQAGRRTLRALLEEALRRAPRPRPRPHPPAQRATGGQRLDLRPPPPPGKYARAVCAASSPRRLHTARPALPPLETAAFRRPPFARRHSILY